MKLVSLSVTGAQIVSSPVTTPRVRDNQKPSVLFIFWNTNWLWWNNFLKQTILLPSQRSTVRETRKILSSEGPRSAGGVQGPNAGKDATANTPIYSQALTEPYSLTSLLTYIQLKT